MVKRHIGGNNLLQITQCHCLYIRMVTIYRPFCCWLKSIIDQQAVDMLVMLTFANGKTRLSQWTSLADLWQEFIKKHYSDSWQCTKFFIQKTFVRLYFIHTTALISTWIFILCAPDCSIPCNFFTSLQPDSSKRGKNPGTSFSAYLRHVLLGYTTNLANN